MAKGDPSTVPKNQGEGKDNSISSNPKRKFHTFCSQILAMDPIPTLGRIFQIAVQEENQWLATTRYEKGGEGVALATLARLSDRSRGGFRPSHQG